MRPTANYTRDFNSIKVQLKLVEAVGVMPFAKFQFHKGTIKTSQRYEYRRAFSDFNSIKVQLKRDTKHHVWYWPKFQFHKGTIKTLVSFTSRLNTIWNFNSIKVQLKQFLVKHGKKISRNFNSIKVQLKQSMPQSRTTKQKFQFHKGTIKTCQWGKACFLPRISIP